MENLVGSEQVLPTDQQGIYTCRIPLQNGTETEINIGIYPSGFNSEYCSLQYEFLMSLWRKSACNM